MNEPHRHRSRRVTATALAITASLTSIAACSDTLNTAREGTIGRTASALGPYSSLRGYLANPGLSGDWERSTYFNPGSWWKSLYSDNGDWGVYFLHPLTYDAAHNPPLYYESAPAPCTNQWLWWSSDSPIYHCAPGNAAYDVNAMSNANLNTILMSYWGPPNTDNYWEAPRHNESPQRDELFDAVTTSQRNIVVIPAIENPTGRPLAHHDGTSCRNITSPGVQFREWFPNVDQAYAVVHGRNENPLVEWITDLVRRYILNPQSGCTLYPIPCNPNWESKFAKMYDRDGLPRYAIFLQQGGSSQDTPTPNNYTPFQTNYSAFDIVKYDDDSRRFAQGFDALAERIKAITNVDVGFLFDPIPPAPDGMPATYDPNAMPPQECDGVPAVRYTPTRDYRTAAKYLVEQKSFLAIHPGRASGSKAKK